MVKPSPEFNNSLRDFLGQGDSLMQDYLSESKEDGAKTVDNNNNGDIYLKKEVEPLLKLLRILQLIKI